MLLTQLAWTIILYDYGYCLFILGIIVYIILYINQLFRVAYKKPKNPNLSFLLYVFTNSLALEFGLTLYDQNDYIRDFEDFQKMKRMEKYNVFDCSIVELDKHHSERKGNLSVVGNSITLPFDVKRVYYLYDDPGGESRVSHAHRDFD